MGADSIKRELRETINSYQYQENNQQIWEILEQYDKMLLKENTPDELAEAAFFRGQASFHAGRYYDTVNALTQSLSIEKTREYAYLEYDAYNVLGMLFSFVGYETVALENYLAAEEAARKNQDREQQIVVLLNEGILYQSLLDHKKAMECCKKGYELAKQDHVNPNLNLQLVCLIQQARLFCQMEQYEEALQMKQEIDVYYHAIMDGEFLLPKCLLEIVLEEIYGTEKKRNELIEQMIRVLSSDYEYLEQIDFYLELCTYLIEKNRKEQSRKLMDILMGKLRTTEFLYLRMKLEELEVTYQQKYSSHAQYLKTCGQYMKLQQEYEQTLKNFKQLNLANIESLQEIEKQRMEFEIRSHSDLATGLLNKDTFQYEVERYLAEKNRDVMDAFLIIDIDDFKLVNDRFGHLVGDEVIARLAELLREQFADECICGRFGGDEFVVMICKITDIYQLEHNVEQFRESFAKARFGRKNDINNTVSIGVSYNQGINTSFSTMFSCADEALFKAKEYGKNRVTFFEIKRGL